jgi:hypothetical protein
MARVRQSLGDSAELVTIELTRHDVNRLKALSKGLGWPVKKRQVSLNTVFAYGLDVAEEVLEERGFGRSRAR